MSHKKIFKQFLNKAVFRLRVKNSMKRKLKIEQLEMLNSNTVTV